MKNSEYLNALFEKYSEHLEMVGVNEGVLIRILINQLAKEIEKTDYLTKSLKLLEVEYYKKCLS